MLNGLLHRVVRMLLLSLFSSRRLACGRGGGGVPIPTWGHTLWYVVDCRCRHQRKLPIRPLPPERHTHLRVRGWGDPIRTIRKKARHSVYTLWVRRKWHSVFITESLTVIIVQSTQRAVIREYSEYEKCVMLV
jgi:hypothetical protein